MNPSPMESVEALLGEDAGAALLSLPPEAESAVREVFGEGATAQLRALEARQPVLAERAVRVANAAFFGQRARMRSLLEAVEQLGSGSAAGLVVAAHVFGSLEARPIPRISGEKFEVFTLRVAALARRFAEPHGLPAEAFICGLLLDVGKLVLAMRRPREFGTVVDLAADGRRMSHLVETEVIGLSHPAVGARLLERWGLPASVVETVALHHTPRLDVQSVKVLACVHAADALLGILASREPETALSLSFMEQAGMLGELDAWRALAREEAGRVIR